MRFSKTTAFITCDRCNESRPLEGLPETWISITASFIANIHAPETTHDLCPECSAVAGKFLNGDFVPPIPDLIEQPYESLTFDDFFDALAAWRRAPWECELIDGQHRWVWGKKILDNGRGLMTRHCGECGLLWSSSKRIEG